MRLFKAGYSIKKYRGLGLALEVQADLFYIFIFNRNHKPSPSTSKPARPQVHGPSRMLSGAGQQAAEATTIRVGLSALVTLQRRRV